MHRRGAYCAPSSKRRSHNGSSRHPLALQQAAERSLERLLPWPWLDTEVANNGGAIKPGIGGPGGWCWILGSADRHNFHRARKMGELEDHLCELKPSSFAGACEVIKAIR